jgi:hypothetical protein
MTRQDQIVAKFTKFHMGHPKVWICFKELAFTAMGKGYDNWSSNGIFEVIRWNTKLGDETDTIRLLNEFRAYYSRMFEAVYPEHKGFFRTRKLPSENQAAFKHEPTPNLDPPGDETDLTAYLVKLANGSR